MRAKVEELSGKSLDWAVARCEGWKWKAGTRFGGEYWFELSLGDEYCTVTKQHNHYCRRRLLWELPFSTSWSLGGPILERESISTTNFDDYPKWTARYPSNPVSHTGCTLLVAAMRAYVYSKLGEDIDVPEEILK
jgi:hypothetical protein